MTILYKCTILAAKDPKGDYHRHYVEIESEYCIPTNRLKTMLAAYGVDVIIENDKVQAIAGKSLDVLEKQLDKYLESSKNVPVEETTEE